MAGTTATKEEVGKQIWRRFQVINSNKVQQIIFQKQHLSFNNNLWHYLL
jgi:hypothetical protein